MRGILTRPLSGVMHLPHGSLIEHSWSVHEAKPPGFSGKHKGCHGEGIELSSIKPRLECLLMRCCSMFGALNSSDVARSERASNAVNAWHGMRASSKCTFLAPPVVIEQSYLLTPFLINTKKCTSAQHCTAFELPYVL
jgi:hypothetical protein